MCIASVQSTRGQEVGCLPVVSDGQTWKQMNSSAGSARGLAQSLRPKKGGPTGRLFSSVLSRFATLGPSTLACCPAVLDHLIECLLCIPQQIVVSRAPLLFRAFLLLLVDRLRRLCACLHLAFTLEGSGPDNPSAPRPWPAERFAHLLSI